MFKILIVDDSMEKTNDLKSCISKYGLEDVAVDYELEVKKACRQLEKNYYDLVILDIQLPAIEIEDGMAYDGGVQILELVSTIDNMKKPMSIIGLTAHDEKYNEIEKKFNEKLFHLVKYDRTSNEWSQKICRKIDYLIKAKEDAISNNEKRKVDCAIITAVPVEFEAVKNINLNWEKILLDEDTTTYYLGKKRNEKREYTILLAMQDQMGMVAASSFTTKIINYFHPKLIAMLGIAGGFEGEAELGDILVATESWDYGSGKIVEDTENGGYILKCEPHQIRLKPVLKNYLQDDFSEILLEIRKKWNNSNGEEKKKDIELILGPVVSGSAVVQDSNLVREYILPQNRKVKGLDMETYAVYYAADSTIIDSPAFISLKAVSDFANKEKNDGYQKYGAFVSANFFFSIFDDLFQKVDVQ